MRLFATVQFLFRVLQYLMDMGNSVAGGTVNIYETHIPTWPCVFVQAKRQCFETDPKWESFAWLP